MAEKQLCIVSGLSGAGKSTALGAFEDIDYFAVDGLPAGLMPEMAAMFERPAMSRYHGMALGMDLREHDFVNEFENALLKLPSRGLAISLVFLDASESELLRRYAYTRRPHPLEKDNMGLAEAISSERARLEPLRAMSDIVIDSTDFSIHDMRRAILHHFSANDSARHGLKVNLISFGYKYGIPKDADFVFDMRHLPNPFFVENLRLLSGKDAAVAAYVFDAPAARELEARICAFLVATLPQIEEEGRSRVTIAMGCTGGRHRSVAMAEQLCADLRSEGYSVLLEHRHILAAS